MWKTPLAYYSPIHFAAIAIMLAFMAIGIVLGIKDKDSGKKRDKLLTVLGFVFIALEAFKIIFKIAVKEDADLRLISFQICSIPMYLLPCIYFMKEGKLKQAFIGYVSFQSFTSAFFYFVKPAAVPGTLVDLFYISRESTFSFPLLGIFFKTHSPYVLFFISFLVYYFIGGFAVYGIGLGIRTLVTKKKA